MLKVKVKVCVCVYAHIKVLYCNRLSAPLSVHRKAAVKVIGNCFKKSVNYANKSDN